MNDRTLRTKILLALAALAAMAAPPPARAEAPDLLTYQGRLRESGQPVNGNRSVRIDFCSDPGGATCFNGAAQGVAVSNGVFRATFTVPSGVFLETGEWYLKISVGGSPLSPLERLTASVYALHASSASTLAARVGNSGVIVSTNVYIYGSTLTVAGQDASGYSLRLSSGLHAPLGTVSAGLFVGSGAGLTNLPPAVGAVAKAGDTMTGQLVFDLAGAALGAGTGREGVRSATSVFVGDGSAVSTITPQGISASAYSSKGIQVLEASAGGAVLHGFSGSVLKQSFFTGPGATERLTIGADGSVGVSSPTAAVPLAVSTGAGYAGDVLVVSTGGVPMMRVTGEGAVHAARFIGDGSGLSNVGLGSVLNATNTWTAPNAFLQEVSLSSHLAVNNAVIVARGSVGAPSDTGAGTRFMWIPSSGSIRAGRVIGANWDPGNIGTHSVAFGDNPEASGNSSAVGGGSFNRAQAILSVVAGGSGNDATGDISAVLGGNANQASGRLSTVGGGLLNRASAEGAMVGGGEANTASGLHATVPGGLGNVAAGAYSFAAGLGATATARGTFVWADASGSPLTVGTTNTFYVRSQGGFVIDASSLTLKSGGGAGCFRYNQGAGQLQYSDDCVTFQSFATSGGGWQRLGTDVFLANIGDRVGIGTSVPDRKLDVNGGLVVRSSAEVTGAGLGAPEAVFRAAGSTFVVRMDGRVGLGSPSPAERLHLLSASPTGMLVEGEGARFRLFAANIGATLKTESAHPLRFGSNDAIGMSLGSTGLHVSTSVTVAGSSLTVLGAASDAYALKVATGAGLESQTTLFVSTFVGIGTTQGGDPGDDDRLLVNGNIVLRGQARALKFDGFGGLGWAETAYIAGSHSPDNIHFIVSGGTRLWFSASGQVGVGTDAPAARLHVSSGAGWAGDVVMVSTGASAMFRVTGEGHMVAEGSVTARVFVGDGSGLTNIGFGSLFNATNTWTAPNSFQQPVSLSSHLAVNDAAIVARGSVGAPGDTGAGTRFMWIPSSGSIRAGRVEDGRWDPAGIGAFSAAFGYRVRASGEYSAVGGGDANQATGYASVVAGGSVNDATGFAAAVLGGNGNKAAADYAAVGGGQGNTATGEKSVVAGGGSNRASGNLATVPGGYGNWAAGAYSFAAGLGATATARGTFVWADASGGPLTVGTTNAFYVRSQNGFVVDAASFTLKGGGAQGCLRHNGVTLQYSDDCVSFQGFGAGSGWQRLGTDVFLANIGDRVGIGTSVPDRKLDVNGGLVVRSSAEVTAAGLQGLDPVFRVAGSTLVVRYDGKVGIGTTTPAALLTIEGLSGDLLLARNTFGGEMLRVSAGGDVQTASLLNDNFRGSDGIQRMRITGPSIGMSVPLTVTGGSVTVVGPGGVNEPYSLAVTTRADRSRYDFVVSTTGRVGVGTSRPNELLDIYADGESAIIQANAYNDLPAESGVPALVLRRSRGSQTSPFPVQAGDWLGGVAMAGRDGIGEGNVSAVILAKAAENWAGSNNHGTRLLFQTTPIGSGQTRDSLVIEPDASVGIATGTPQARLHVSSGAGWAGDVVVVSTGMSAVLRVTGEGHVVAVGSVSARVFVGDGSQLTGIGGGGWTDNASVVSLANGADNVVIQSTLTVQGDAFSVGGATLVVRQGRVGVGTPSPATTFHVMGELLVENAAGAVLRLEEDPGSRFSLTYDGGLFAIRPGLPAQVSALSITNGHTVGVGTDFASPQARLHVSSSAAMSSDNILLVSNGMLPGNELLVVKGDGKLGVKSVAPVYDITLGTGTRTLGIEGADGSGGTLTVRAADGNPFGGGGGDLRLKAGSAQVSANNGGSVYLIPGSSTTTGASGNVVIDGSVSGGAHLKAVQTNTPTITVVTNCGGTTGITPGSTDMAGKFTIGISGEQPDNSCDTRINFKQPYGSPPKAVLLTAGNQAAAENSPYVFAVSSGDFTVRLRFTTSETSTDVYYLVIE